MQDRPCQEKPVEESLRNSPVHLPPLRTAQFILRRAQITSRGCVYGRFLLQPGHMKIVRLYTGPDNESHFEDVEIELKAVKRMMASALEPAHGIMFRSAPADHYSNYHPAPNRQYVITLSGAVEIETGDGAIRRFGPGDVMLAEDTTGHGHITRVVGGQPRHYAFIPLK